MKNYPANCHVIRVEDDNTIDQKRANALKYWCNACGELHHHGKFDIQESELPKPLRRAYNEIWEEGAAGCCCYLVETKEVGYGVALVAEYDEYFANKCGVSMDEMFDKLLQDMEYLAVSDALWYAHLYALEYAGCDECHELAIVVPANIPASDWEAVKKAVKAGAYASLKKQPISDNGESILLVNFNYQPEEYPGHMLLKVKTSDMEEAKEIVERAFTKWARMHEDDGAQVSFLEETIEEALMAAGIWFQPQQFDVVEIDLA